MKMKLLEPLMIKFTKADWSKNPEFALLDTLLEPHPELIHLVEKDIVSGGLNSDFGRKDIPSVEQIFRAGIYKELRQLTYRELEYHQSDSRICAQFLKIDELRPYSFQMYQKYISKIKAENLEKVLIAINKIAIDEGMEDLEKIRVDSTTVETNIHYPTNNSLVWDCIKESNRLLLKLKAEIGDLDYRDYTKHAKKIFYKINNTKVGDKRIDLFKSQLITFTKCINQISNAIKKKDNCSWMGMILITDAIKFLPTMLKVYSMAERREIKGLIVPNSEKIFSICEQHTDIIVKGAREVEFGHKINLVAGKSSLILVCDICIGNPPDKELYKPALDAIEQNYNTIPRDIACDGGYATMANGIYAQMKGIKNIVFNKVVGSLQNIVSSVNIETRLKKWRSGIEATISNLKRGFSMFRCEWKGFNHFCAKVMWSAIGYNIRIMTTRFIMQMK